ncbi:MAG: PAS domain-containing protein [Candidatus Zixiibacteriota bacterium]|jgi:PAS domain S-box-containing protein
MREAERLKLLVEESPAILWAYDEVNGRMIYVNAAVEETLGHSRKRFYERSAFWFELIHPDDRTEVSAQNHFMRVEKRAIQYEIRFRRADGSYMRVRAVVKPIVDERGRIVRTEGAAIPIWEDEGQGA